MLGEQLQVNGDILFSQLDPTATTTADKRQGLNRDTVNLAVKLRPASTSQRMLQELYGRTKNVSLTGCGLILSHPPYVGDIYRFQSVDGSEIIITGVLGRCVRCHLIDEDVFEAGFEFLTPLREDRYSAGLL
jgi:hypothetical protein